MTPEQQARQNIDRQLSACGWVVQDRQGFNPGAGAGIAVREYPTDTGNADYVLFLNRRAVGVIEAKREDEVLTVKAEGQAQRYATSGQSTIWNNPSPKPAPGRWCRWPPAAERPLRQSPRSTAC